MLSIGATYVCASLFLASCVSPAQEGKGDTSFVSGADMSALPVFERCGAAYRYRDGVQGDALRIFRAEGLNCFRLRLFVDPTEGGVVCNDLDYTLALARRVKASGAALMLDIHYSDTWADPSKQFLPKAWEGLDFDALCAQVRDYTCDVLARFIEEGLRPDYVQLGNEITNGMLWPQGRVEFAEKDDLDAWQRLGALQRAAAEGFDAACSSGPFPKIILHIESTGNLPRTAWYIESAAANGVRYDILGLSYYPQWHGTLADLSATLNLAAEKSGRPVMVVETAYPWKKSADWSEGAENLAFAPSPKGQRDFTRAVVDAVKAVPEGRGCGVIWWHPESVLVDGVHVWLGGDCALFDDEGRILPAASALIPRR